MYRKRTSTPPAAQNTDVPELDVRADLNRATLVCLIRQQAMRFGSDRRVAVNARPAVLIRARDNFIFVLPSTTHDMANRPQFYALHKADVMWKEPEKSRDSFIFHRYATVHRDDVVGALGMLYPAAQLAIVNWLRSRY